MKPIDYLNKKKNTIYILTIIIYLCSYTILSICGEYQITMSGENRYLVGLAMMDMYKWTPYGVVCEIYRGPNGSKGIRGLNFLGALYSPVVWFDRKYIHKSVYILERDLPEPTPKEVR
jgi:hypothetical protein